MKRLFFIISLLIFGISAKSQVAVTKMQLSATEHDFGTFKEEAGRQTFDFIITNTGTEPLVIQNVVASCGCTTPEWTKQPIPAGAKGKVTAIYDPKDRPGQFNKTLSQYIPIQNLKSRFLLSKVKSFLMKKLLRNCLHLLLVQSDSKATIWLSPMLRKTKRK
jgi:hypothetical protein